MPKRELTKVEIQVLLDEIAERLATRGVEVRIYVVGGAALALTMYGDHERRGTLDIDAAARMDEAMAEEIAEMAIEHGLGKEWFNNDAKIGFPPNGFPPGTTFVEHGKVTVIIAPPDLLLAMKLRAARWGRDDEDIAPLVRELDVRTDEEAKAILDRYYLGEEALKPDALDILTVTREAFDIETARPPIHLEPLAEREEDQIDSLYPGFAPIPPQTISPPTRCTGLYANGARCGYLAQPGTDRCRRRHAN